MLRIVKNFRFNLGRFVGNNSYLFPLFYLSKSRKEGIIRKDSDICIEGFQRSANTFFHFNFKRWNRNTKRAHHLHSAGQVLKSLQLKKPTIVLIRRPIDAVSSLLVKDLNLDIGIALKSYNEFYTKLAPFRKQFIIGHFEDVVDQPGQLIKKINDKFGTNFHYEILTEKNKNRFKQIIQNANARKDTTSSWRRSSVPSEAKNKAKTKIKDSIESHRLYHEAEGIYYAFIN